MLAGIAVTLLLAGGGAAAYVLAFHQPPGRHARPLPSRAITVESVGLVVTSGAADTAGSGNLLQLIDGHAASPEFSPLDAAQIAVGSPQWTADLMGDNTFIFIFLASDTCLTAVGHGAHPGLALEHCNLGTQQRWRRVNRTVIEAGHDYYQYANTSDGKCLTMTSRQTGGDFGTGIAPCAVPPTPSQLIAFWWSSV